MTRVKLYLLSILFLLATVPWFFTEFRSTHVLGFPPWAFYAVISTAVYGTIIAFLLHRYWSLSAGTKQQGPRTKSRKPRAKNQEL